MTRHDIRLLARLAFDPRTIRAWMKALRPASLVIAAFSCFLGVALAWREGSRDITLSILVLAAGILLQAGVNLVNDFFEFKQRKLDDKIAHLAVFGQERDLLEWFIFLTGLACFAAVVPAGLYLAWRSGWPLLVLGAVGFAGGYFYTGEPFNYKRRGLGVVFVFFLMGVFMVAGSWYALTARLSALPVLASLPVSLLVSLILLDQRAEGLRARPAPRHPHADREGGLSRCHGAFLPPARARLRRPLGSGCGRALPVPLGDASCTALCSGTRAVHPAPFPAPQAAHPSRHAPPPCLRRPVLHSLPRTPALGIRMRTAAACALLALLCTTASADLVVGIMPAINSAPLVVAQEMGYFADEGVSVRLELFQGQMQREAALQSRAIDGTVSDLINAILGWSRGAPTAVLAVSQGDFGLLTRPARVSGISETGRHSGGGR